MANGNTPEGASSDEQAEAAQAQAQRGQGAGAGGGEAQAPAPAPAQDTQGTPPSTADYQQEYAKERLLRAVIEGNIRHVSSDVRSKIQGILGLDKWNEGKVRRKLRNPTLREQVIDSLVSDTNVKLTDFIPAGDFNVKFRREWHLMREKLGSLVRGSRKEQQILNYLFTLPEFRNNRCLSHVFDRPASAGEIHNLRVLGEMRELAGQVQNDENYDLGDRDGGRTRGWGRILGRGRVQGRGRIGERAREAGIVQTAITNLDPAVRRARSSEISGAFGEVAQLEGQRRTLHGQLNRLRTMAGRLRPPVSLSDIDATTFDEDTIASRWSGNLIHLGRLHRGPVLSLGGNRYSIGELLTSPELGRRIQQLRDYGEAGAVGDRKPPASLVLRHVLSEYYGQDNPQLVDAMYRTITEGELQSPAAAAAAPGQPTTGAGEVPPTEGMEAGAETGAETAAAAEAQMESGSRSGAVVNAVRSWTLGRIGATLKLFDPSVLWLPFVPSPNPGQSQETPQPQMTLPPETPPSSSESLQSAA